MLRLNLLWQINWHSGSEAAEPSTQRSCLVLDVHVTTIRALSGHVHRVSSPQGSTLIYFFYTHKKNNKTACIGKQDEGILVHMCLLSNQCAKLMRPYLDSAEMLWRPVHLRAMRCQSVPSSYRWRHARHGCSLLQLCPCAVQRSGGCLASRHWVELKGQR